MNNQVDPMDDKPYLKRSLEIAIRLALVALIILACFNIFSPFLTTVVWGIVIAVAIFPIFERVKGRLGGRARLAGTLFIVFSLIAFLVPTIILTQLTIDDVGTLIRDLQEGTVKIPPPNSKVQTWPVIGEDVYRLWQSASTSLGANLENFTPQLKTLGARLATLMGTVGGAVLHTFFALIIAGVLMVNSQSTSKTAHNIGFRLAGEYGVALVDISVSTIRSVVRGVILVAVIQGLLAAIGLLFAHVPAAGLWALLVMIMAVIQLPPILVLGPIIIWVFSANDSTTTAVIFMIWSLVVSVSDGFLKPLLLGRGVQIPMLVILIGAIGGMLKAGVLGLFIGPVVLAIGYQIFAAWMSPALDEKTSDVN